MPAILSRIKEPVSVTLDCESHKPEEDRIQWKVRPMAAVDEIQWEADLRKVYGMDLPEQGPAVNAMLKRIVDGWDNVVDADGQPVPFTEEALDSLSAQEKLVVVNQLPAAAGWKAMETKRTAPAPPRV